MTDADLEEIIRAVTCLAGFNEKMHFPYEHLLKIQRALFDARDDFKKRELVTIGFYKTTGIESYKP